VRDTIAGMGGATEMNKWLHGNGHWCPACRGSGRGRPLDMIEYEGGGYCQFYARCEACNGEGRLAGPGLDVRPEARPLIEYGRRGESNPALCVPV
jgi:hypothetical protein